MPANAPNLHRTVIRYVAVAAAALFALFVATKGIPSLRHDWTWPIDQTAIGSFMSESANGWLSASIGMPNPRPTTYLIALPIGATMWIVGPFVALIAFAGVIGYVCMRAAANAATQWGASWPAALGIGLFALFNPWVYNEVVAGHLVMVLAYGALIGLLAEMLRGAKASSLRLALWIVLLEAQLQFFIPAMVAVVIFGFVTRKWLPPVVGAIVALPSIVGLVAEHGTLVRTPYELAWQTYQSVAPLSLLALGGYFPGYSDRLGVIASAAVWVVVALAIVGAVAARHRRAAIAAAVSAIAVYVFVLGLNGPIAIPYAWIVRNVPESGVFRELYDLAGIFAALLAVLACAAASRVRAIGCVALAAGLALIVSWIVRPPSDLWVGAGAYPHPAIATQPFSRLALLPAFQPLSLRTGAGNGADPDAYVRPNGIAALNEYLPAYPADMALARYEQSGNADALRALGVSQIVPRPWLVSRTRGAIGIAGTLPNTNVATDLGRPRHLDGPMPLISRCNATLVADPIGRLDECALFFGDVPGYAPVRAIAAPSDSTDARTAWIDARLSFAQEPALAQPIGGALTQSAATFAVEPNPWLLAYVRGALRGPDGRTLASGRGNFIWIAMPPGVGAVQCTGLCELVAQTARLPQLPPAKTRAAIQPLEFHAFTPWLYVVNTPSKFPRAGDGLLRFNERYDSAWAAFDSGRALPHVRIDSSLNGWYLPNVAGTIVLIETTALAQMIAEIVGVVCVLILLKALASGPTKRVRPQ